MVHFYLPHRNPLLKEGALTSIVPCLIANKSYIDTLH